MNEQQLTIKQLRRRRRRIRRICTTVILIILAVLITVTFTVIVPRMRILKAFKGDYMRRIDITDQVAANAAVWLKDVEGAEIEAEWVREGMDEIYVDVYLHFEPDGLKKGSFTESLDAVSYSACADKAYSVTGDCLRQLIIKRLNAVGYAETLNDEDADALIREALDMPLEDYIRNAGVNVIPGFDELAEKTDRSGEYRIHGKNIEWPRDNEQSADTFSVTTDTLTIPSAGYIYTKITE